MDKAIQQSSSPLSLAIIINTAATRLAGCSPSTMVKAVTTTFERAGHRVIQVSAGGIGSTMAALRIAASSCDIDGVIVGGGDGTVSAAADLLHPAGKAFGVLPLGNYNHFAGDVGMPPDPLDAARALTSPQRTKVDLGQINGRAFVNRVWLGLYAQGVAERQRQIGLKRARCMADLVAIANQFRRFETMTATIIAPDGAKCSFVTPLINISNNPYNDLLKRRMGRKHLDYGRLMVYVARCSTRHDLALLGLEAVLFGTWDRNPMLTRFPARQFALSFLGDQICASIDGEATPLSSPLAFNIRPSALDILVPSIHQGDGRIPDR